jgi:outer membrane protein TolC
MDFLNYDSIIRKVTYIMNRITLILLLFFGLFTEAHSQSQGLDYYLKEGLQNSPLLKDFQNQINSATIDSILVRAAQKPLIEAKSQLQYSPVYKNFGYDEVITDGGNYQVVAGVSQSIFNRRELDNKFQSIVIQKKSVNNSSKLSETDLKRIITNQYLSSFADYSDLSFNESFLELMYNENEVVKQFVGNGIYNQTDYLSLLIETQGQEILVNQLRTQFRSDLRLLNQICGINTDNTVTSLSKPAIEKAGASDLSKSPFIRQYKLDSLRIVNEKTAIGVKYQPKVSWFADAGILTATPLNFYKHVGYSVGLSLSIPLYDGKQKDYDLQKLELSENTRSFYETGFRNQYSQQLKQLEDELNSLQDLLIQTEKQRNTSDQLIVMSKAQLNVGNVQITDYINAIKNYKNINKNINEIQIKILQTINEINYLMAQ